MENVLILLALTAFVKGFTATNNTHGLYECANGIIIENYRKCDGVNDCRNWDDECDCDALTPSLCEKRPCLNSNQLVRRRQLCDGIFDCDDLSDECLCDRVTDENQVTRGICDGLVSSEKTHGCDAGSFSCSYYNGQENELECQDGRRICDGVTNCNNGIDEMYCARFDSVSTTSSTNNSCGNPIISKVNESLVLGCMCDGIVDFHDGYDERHCSRYFYCSNNTDDFVQLYQDNFAKSRPTMFGDRPGIFIDWRRKFDGIEDCPDISDEWHEHFVYCHESQIPMVSNQANCPTHSKRRMASARYAMKSRLFVLLQWLIGFITACANGAVVALTVRSLIRGNRAVELRTKRANQVLVLNLCLSNMLLGVQMIVIGASDASMVGEYWKHDISWKSSSLCHAIGFLAIVLTQVSILTIFVISALRLFTVARPFSVIKLRYIVIIAVAIWLVGAFAAKMPTLHLVPELENYFINSVAIPNLPQVDATVIERKELNNLLQRSAVLHNMFKNQDQIIPDFPNMRWHELEVFLNNINPLFGNWKYFGYFAHTSICLPTVIVNLGGYAWEYVFVTVIVDVCAYAFVIVAYVIVMKKTASFKNHMCFGSQSSQEKRSSVSSLIQAARIHVKQRKKISNSESSQMTSNPTAFHDRVLRSARDKENYNLQKRIFWLVFTDFLCWAPILIINILNMAQPLSQASLKAGLGISFILLQINSMVNPFIYSRTVRRGLFSIILVPCRIIKNKLLPSSKTDDNLHYAPYMHSNTRTESQV